MNQPHEVFTVCPQCGNQLNSRQAFCPKCGTPAPKKPEKVNKKKKSWVLKGICFVLVLVLLVGGVGTVLYIRQPKTPNVVGLSLEEALNQLSRFSVEHTAEYSNTVPAGQVLKQSIEPGTRVPKEENKIALVVSKGPGVSIPPLTNQPLEKAKTTLENLGLTVTVTKEYHTTVPANCVISVSHTLVDPGATVSLTVSLGVDSRIEVPNLLGEPEKEAKKLLTDLGFQVKIEYTYQKCDVFSGEKKVINQDLTGKQNKGTVVTLTVTKPAIQITKLEPAYNEYSSYGSLNFTVHYQNVSKEQIRNVTFNVIFRDEKGENCHRTPLEMETKEVVLSGAHATGHWNNVIFDWDVREITFDSIVITFMDDTIQTLSCDGSWYWERP